MKLRIYNLAGQLVRQLVDEAQPAGHHQVAWEGADDQGRGLGSGIYLCRLSAGGEQYTRKMALLR